jgi:tetratricopeptide (TPR) repeat protein/DNA-binding XRE family transcriptional regulator
MARVKKGRETDEPIHIGRVLAVLREALDWTQSDLARESGVKRGSISEYESGKSTPDVVTLERLLSAMRFRWIALDFGRWFVDWLLTHCRIPEGEDGPGATAPPLGTVSSLATQLSADVAATNQTALLLSKLVVMLQEEQRAENPSSESDNQDTPARDRKAEQRAAQALWSRIKPLSHTEQAEALRSAPSEAQRAVCDLLCKESQRLCEEDPGKATMLCELALVAADLAEGGEGMRSKLRGLAWAHLGNSLRARGDLEGAEGAFASADEFWKVGDGMTDGIEEGIIFALKASLRRAQRQFDEAKHLLERAWLLASDPTFRVQVMVSKAKLLEEMGDLDEAAALLRQVKETASPEIEARLLLRIWHNLSDTLSKLERFEEAVALLPQTRAYLLKAGGELNRARLMWTEGRIAAGLGDVEEGIALLSRVRGEFASRDMAYDMALVSLEIAVLYAGLGRTEQVKTLARHMTPIFQAHAIHREAIAALTLFRKAAEQEEVTVEFAYEVLSYLRKARYNPELRFRE